MIPLILRHKFKFFLLFYGLVAVGLLAPSLSRAAEPELFVTWQAKTYTPAFYTGKALPTGNSLIVASVMLVANGKIVDLSGQTIYWYVNDTYVDGGVGVTHVSFRAPGIPPNTISLRAKLPDYNGNELYGNASLPVVKPEAIMSVQKSNTFLGAGESVRIAGYPFFFNITKPSSLRFEWLANREPPTTEEDPQGLTVKFAEKSNAESTIATSLTITNPLGKFEIASNGLLLRLKP